MGWEGDKRSQRLRELDGLRGLAALSVFFLHLSILGPPWIPRGLWGIGRDGIAAVDLFFVLSGFVLARSLLLDPQDYLTFIRRRFLRLYPAYWAALVLAAALSLMRNRAGLADLHQYGAGVLWERPITLQQAAKHLFMITPGINFEAIDSPIWSLVVEMRISLLLPLMLAGFLRLPPLLQFTALVMSPALGLIPSMPFGLQFVPMFLLGIALAVYVAPGPHPWWLITLLFVGGTILCSNGQLVATGRLCSDYVAAAGAAMLIIVAISSRWASKLLLVGPVQWLGHISYSFYLVHLPAIVFVTSWVFPRTQSTAFCVLASLITAIGIATALRRWIELPGLRLPVPRVGYAFFPR